MFKFFSDAKQELEHVVWPTQNETKKYMSYTVGVIVVMAFLLAVVGYTLQSGLGIIRDQFPHDSLSYTVSGEELATQEDLNAIIDTFSGKVTTVSGEAQ